MTTTTKRVRLATNDHATRAIANRHEFTNAGTTFHARWYSDMPETGSAPTEVVNALKADMADGARVYVVFSYRTPIAWAREDSALLTVPDTRYSNTTSRHQRTAVGGRLDPEDFSREYVKTGEWVAMGDPGSVRRGRGQTPFAPRGGW